VASSTSCQTCFLGLKKLKIRKYKWEVQIRPPRPPYFRLPLGLANLPKVPSLGGPKASSKHVQQWQWSFTLLPPLTPPNLFIYFFLPSSLPFLPSFSTLLQLSHIEPTNHGNNDDKEDPIPYHFPFCFFSCWLPTCNNSHCCARTYTMKRRWAWALFAPLSWLHYYDDDID
jgi:hypothetical protein